MTRHVSTAAAFVVSIHDVCPSDLEAIRTLLDSVAPRVHTAISLAVMPQPVPSSTERLAMAALIARADETLLHGWSHRRGPSLDPFSWLVGRNDEFAALDRDETITRLAMGIAAIEKAYGVRVAGTIPPAWRVGRIAACLATVGLDFMVGLNSLATHDGGQLALATSSWDPGPIRPLWRACEMLGRPPFASRSAVPVVALHPADVRRALLPRALAMIDRHLAAGRRAVTFQQLTREHFETNASTPV